MIRQEEFTCMRDDLMICGTVYIPEGKNLPAAVVSHGFMDTRRGTKKYAKMLAEEGYAAFCFDFCGGGVRSESDGKSTEMSVFTEVQDLKAVMEYALGRPYTDGKTVVLMGCSQGGYVSAITAAEMPEAVTKLILFYPALCIPDDARKGKMIMAKFDPANIPETVKCGPMKLGRIYPQSVLAIDPFAQIRPYQGEVLIVHGAQDRLVDPSYSARAKDAYGECCTYKVILNGTHGFAADADELAVFYVKEFLKGYREILTVDVWLTGRELKKDGWEADLRLPFVGTAQSLYFTGGILPGAADVQRRKGSKLLHACADYTMKGTDCAGKDCTVHVVNTHDGTAWKPVVTTDSEALSFVNGADCDVQLEHRKQGPVVHIFCPVPDGA